MADFVKLNDYDVKDKISREYVDSLNERLEITDFSELSGGGEHILAQAPFLDVRTLPLELLQGKNFKYITIEFKNGVKWHGRHNDVFGLGSDYYKYESLNNYAKGEYLDEQDEKVIKANGLINITSFKVHGSSTDYIMIYFNFANLSSLKIINENEEELVKYVNLVNGDQKSLTPMEVFLFYEMEKIVFSNEI